MGGMVPEDVYEITGAFDPRVSPDGRTVAYVVLSVDREANEYRAALVELLYTDEEGAQRAITAFLLAPGKERWLCSAIRHWNLDRPDPR